MAHKPLTKKKLPDKNCKNCDDSFTPYRDWQEYCSPSCRGQYYWKTHEIKLIEPNVVPEQTTTTNN